MSSADSLTTSARVFYEQTRFKMVVSIFLGSMAMMSLAYVSSYGGESNSANFLKNKYDNLDDDHLERAQEALAGGYGNILHLCTEKNIYVYLIFTIFSGFAAFMFFVAFSVFLTGAIYASPMFCGSPNEKKMVTKPQELDSGELNFCIVSTSLFIYVMNCNYRLCLL